MSTACGSPVYAAPELVMTGKLYTGKAVDIWSCGIILFAMLCGYLPFDDDINNPHGNNIGRLYRFIATHKPKFPSHVSPEARDLIGKMLIPDPAKRCKLQTIIKHPWLKKYRNDIIKLMNEHESLEKKPSSTASTSAESSSSESIPTPSLDPIKEPIVTIPIAPITTPPNKRHTIDLSAAKRNSSLKAKFLSSVKRPNKPDTPVIHMQPSKSEKLLSWIKSPIKSMLVIILMKF